LLLRPELYLSHFFSSFSNFYLFFVGFFISLEILTIMIESEGWMKPAEDEKGTVFDC
jgi:hypothetical protein